MSGMKHAGVGDGPQVVSVSSPAFTLASWPFAVPHKHDDGRQRVVVGERMFDRVTHRVAYGQADPVPVDEWEWLISETDFKPFLRGETTELPPPRRLVPAEGDEEEPAPPRRQRTRGGRK